jgi:hypothetical protein
MLQILTTSKQEEVELDRLRIWDFYLVFPREMKNISIPNELAFLREYKRRDRSVNPYEDLIDPKSVFDRMNSFQMAALRCLASYLFIDVDQLEKRIIKKTRKEIPDELRAKLSDLNEDQMVVMKYIEGFREFPLHGLKERTALIEFKYDSR